MKFGYTILYVVDVPQTVAFYEAAFGLTRNFVHESGYGEMSTGDTKLAFASYELVRSNGVSFLDSPREGSAPPVEIAFVTNDVEAAYHKAIEAGAKPVAEPKERVRDNFLMWRL